MCTSLTFTNPALYGRNLDLETPFGQTLVIAKRSYPFPFHCRKTPQEGYAMMGMARVEGDVPLFAEAMNEKGLYMAGLNFPGNAHYFPDGARREGDVAPYELIPLVLGACQTLSQARALLSTLRVTAMPLAPGYPLAPLHWHLADATGSVTLEPMEDGLHLYENPAGVLTNNPPFPFQMMNLNNYQALSPRQPENRFAPQLDLAPYGQGMGGIGLPGDASPMSRFVRTVFLKEHSEFTGDGDKDVVQFFRILDAVAMVAGSVVTPEGHSDKTLYTCCMDAARRTCYYKTYFSSRICALTLTEEACRGSGLLIYPLEESPVFCPAKRQEEQA